MDKKILLVEDDHFINSLYMRILTQAGFNMTLAKDGAEGIKVADKTFDLILLDIMLPKVDGVNVLRKLKENPDTKKIPVILLTNLGQGSVIKSAFEIGAQGYLLKMNVTPYELVDKIKPFLQDPSFQMDLNQLDLE